MSFPAAFFGALLLLTLWGIAAFRRGQRRERFIQAYRFDASVRRQLGLRYPQLTAPQQEQVLEALQDFFQLCRLAGRRRVSMPSQAADEAWHAFILSTRAYQDFCRQAFGRFLHHHPAETMHTPTQAGEGIRRAWRLACHREGIAREQPQRLPRLFALDAALGIAGGFVYSLDCQRAGTGYCASHIGCSSGCSGDSGSDGGDGGGCGGD